MRTNNTLATALESIAMELHLKGEPAAPSSDPYAHVRLVDNPRRTPGAEWTCPLCLDEWSWETGKRRRLHKTVNSETCPCYGMPGEILVKQPDRERRTPSMEALDIREVQERLEAARAEVAKLERAERTLMACTAHGAKCECLACVPKRRPVEMKYEDGFPA